MGNNLTELCKLIRYDIVTSTTQAGSGHPTSSLSAVELMTTLFFDGNLHYDFKNPKYLFNDRIIFSKGHASPLLYSLYHAAGAITYEELMKLRTFESNLEGHPTPLIPYVDVATGSLGQGLSVGLGMALGLKQQLEIQNISMKRTPMVWVLLGDSEMAEGQIWEALELASYYKAQNLVGILDVNRLGQRGETMLGWDIETYQKRISAFGWNTVIVEDGHNIEEIKKAFSSLNKDSSNQAPTMILAKTIKGKGVSFLENKEGWHGKALPKDKLDEALQQLGKVDTAMTGTIPSPEAIITDQTIQSEELDEVRDKLFALSNTKNVSRPTPTSDNSTQNSSFTAHELQSHSVFSPPTYKKGDLLATREAYGDALLALGKENPCVIALDGEVSNSTYSEKIKSLPYQFVESFIAEQNMVSMGLGFSKVGFTPFMSSFAAFLTRAYDQLRLSQYSQPNIKVVGSHVGVSIGEDGSSQMGLEDIAMIRTISKSIIFYPSDGISTYKLVEQMGSNIGFFYMRTTRGKLPIIYSDKDSFEIGGSQVLHDSSNDKAVIFTAGITVHEALKAYEELQKEKINVAVVDLYSIKPIDTKTINELAKKIGHVIIVEDHYPAGGIGEAVRTAMDNSTLSKLKSFTHLAVNKLPHSGKPEELLAFEEIDAQALIKTVKSLP